MLLGGAASVAVLPCLRAGSRLKAVHEYMHAHDTSDGWAQWTPNHSAQDALTHTLVGTREPTADD